MAYTETWKFRFEIPDDLDWLEEGGTDWEEMGLELVDFDWDQLYDTPDKQPTGTVVFGARDRYMLRAALERLTRHINTLPDTHVLIESLKPAAEFDGRRDGPFADPADAPDALPPSGVLARLKSRLMR